MPYLVKVAALSKTHRGIIKYQLGLDGPCINNLRFRSGWLNGPKVNTIENLIFNHYAEQAIKELINLAFFKCTYRKQQHPSIALTRESHVSIRMLEDIKVRLKEIRGKVEEQPSIISLIDYFQIFALPYIVSFSNFRPNIMSQLEAELVINAANTHKLIMDRHLACFVQLSRLTIDSLNEPSAIIGKWIAAEEMQKPYLINDFIALYTILTAPPENILDPIQLNKNLTYKRCMTAIAPAYYMKHERNCLSDMPVQAIEEYARLYFKKMQRSSTKPDLSFSLVRDLFIDDLEKDRAILAIFVEEFELSDAIATAPAELLEQAETYYKVKFYDKAADNFDAFLSEASFNVSNAHKFDRKKILYKAGSTNLNAKRYERAVELYENYTFIGGAVEDGNWYRCCAIAKFFTSQKDETEPMLIQYFVQAAPNSVQDYYQWMQLNTYPLASEPRLPELLVWFRQIANACNHNFP